MMNTWCKFKYMFARQHKVPEFATKWKEYETNPRVLNKFKEIRAKNRNGYSDVYLDKTTHLDYGSETEKYIVFHMDVPNDTTPIGIKNTIHPVCYWNFLTTQEHSQFEAWTERPDIAPLFVYKD